MEKNFLKILSLFSIICMCIFNVSATEKVDNNLSVKKEVPLVKSNNEAKNNVIHIAMATDNNYAYLTIVAMTSIFLS